MPSERSDTTLESDALTVVVAPERGADILSIVDRRTGVDLLFRPPWPAEPAGRAQATNSATAWLDGYPGGWQLLLPNGGDACSERGAEWGFHGEACVRPWQVDRATARDIGVSVTLQRAPLAVSRRISLTGAVLTIDETVTNTSPDAVELMWSHHPAFGAPFLGGGCEIVTGASRYVADEVAPGSVLAAGSEHRWPHAHRPDGSVVDLSVVPGPDQRGAQFGYLRDFSEGFFAIRNPQTQLGVAMTWPLDVFPEAWFWQEIHHTADYPWFRRAYVTAIEPCTTSPGHGIAHARSVGGRPMQIDGGASRSARIEAVVFHSRHRVRRVLPGGDIEFEEDRS
ncbi:MAG TPA: aldose 1-epimerase [Ilumatobacter sp.]|nr:aldose 1-epimerase [Ilumatobacter sp.]